MKVARDAGGAPNERREVRASGRMITAQQFTAEIRIVSMQIVREADG